MKNGAWGLGLLAVLSVSRGALAQVPPPKTGFQMALRTGYSAPFGKVTEGLKLSDFSSGQVPLIVDIGGKPIPHLFLGGYLGLGFGGAGGSTADTCDQLNAGCFGLSLRFGIQAQVHFLPGEKFNPWLGYGIGLESLGLGIDQNDSRGAVAAGVGGFEFAHLMAGADVRLTRVIGIGPFVDFSFGRYNRVTLDDGDTTTSYDIESSNRATHGWATFGLRVVFFP
ncbi:MAG: hypothetical protein EOO73_34670 [Myxococcales bacterium]|nr:MAG: hypothetical protein EOO73_34670 [Myxococcales bacterium]